MRMVLASLVLGLLFGALSAGGLPGATEAHAESHTETVTLQVEGMTCGGCEWSVETTIKTLPGIVSAKASWEAGLAVVEYEPDKVTPAEMAGAVNTKTYFVASVAEGVQTSLADSIAGASDGGGGDTVVIKVDGMDSQLAASRVSAVMGRPGIVDASANLEVSTFEVQYEPARISPSDLVSAINTDTPYRASILSSTEQPEDGAAGQVFKAGKYVVWAIGGLFALALAWTAGVWTWRRLAGPASQ